MKILFILNYYYPYVSGVTETTKLLAESLAKKEGYEVSVLCSNHDKLPAKENINGVNVYRAPIIMKISKGTVSLDFIKMAKKMSKDYDIVNVVSPMLESGLLFKLLDNKKMILNYHCDINLRKSLMNNFIVSVMDFSHKLAFKHANKIIFSSIDYAKSSRIGKDYIYKGIGIAPLYKNKTYEKGEFNPNAIGFCGRIVEEKGIDVLLKAFEIIKKEIPEAELRIAGDYKNVAGGSIYNELIDYVNSNNLTDVKFLGKVPEKDLNRFYSELGVFVLPSTNSLEAFGLVQLEAMNCGVPVVASDLPGVRTIVQNTGMGLIAKTSDEKDLAEKIIKVLKNRKDYVKPKKEIEKIYSNEALTKKYIDVYKEIINDSKNNK